MNDEIMSFEKRWRPVVEKYIKKKMSKSLDEVYVVLAFNMNDNVDVLKVFHDYERAKSYLNNEAYKNYDDEDCVHIVIEKATIE